MGYPAVISLNEYKYEKGYSQCNYNVDLRLDTVSAHKKDIAKAMVKGYLKLLSEHIK